MGTHFALDCHPNAGVWLQALTPAAHGDQTSCCALPEAVYDCGSEEMLHPPHAEHGLAELLLWRQFETRGHHNGWHRLLGPTDCRPGFVPPADLRDDVKGLKQEQAVLLLADYVLCCACPSLPVPCGLPAYQPVPGQVVLWAVYLTACSGLAFEMLTGQLHHRQQRCQCLSDHWLLPALCLLADSCLCQNELEHGQMPACR